MRKTICFVLAALLLLPGLSGCGTGKESAPRLTVVAATYPIYLFACAVTGGVEGVEVERLNTGSVSCLHDYTLSVDDMKKLERADVIALNGAGLEDFMEDALGSSRAAVVDCSAGVELLENLSHSHEEGDEGGHDHGHWDPHYWMAPDNAAIMVENLQAGMSQADPDHQEQYQNNALDAADRLQDFSVLARETLAASLKEGGVEVGGLITFHDGFQYFAQAFDLPLLAAIEEEAGSEASAKEIVEITGLVEEYQLPVIFTEVNGSDATARAISRETGCAVSQLTMVMDGPEDGGVDAYCDGMMSNIAAIVNGFAGEEVVAP